MTMNVTTKFSENNTVFTISISGSFDFNSLNSFRQAYSSEEVQSAKIIIDMRSTETIDSSALGMLLNMQRNLNKSDGEISIINCNPVVAKIFAITHFGKKFNIS